MFTVMTAANTTTSVIRRDLISAHYDSVFIDRYPVDVTYQNPGWVSIDPCPQVRNAVRWHVAEIPGVLAHLFAEDEVRCRDAVGLNDVAELLVVLVGVEVESNHVGVVEYRFIVIFIEACVFDVSPRDAVQPKRSKLPKISRKLGSVVKLLPGEVNIAHNHTVSEPGRQVSLRGQCHSHQ